MSLKAGETIRRYAMLPRGARVVAALSGGADSTALLHFLCSLRGEDTLALQVFAAHVNHGLRGPEAQRDEEFCAGLCRRLGVTLYTEHADIRAEAAAHGETQEQAGRRVRYAFFERLGGQLGARVATAHTLSDSIETLLLNLTRGTGLRGLCGIPPVRGRIVRPFVFDTRSDIEAYCTENGLSYVTDSTNFARVYTRNRLRLDVVPVLYDINPGFAKAAARGIANLAEDEACLAAAAEEKLEQARRGENCYSCAALRAQPPALRSRALMRAVGNETGTEPEAVHVAAMTSLLETGGRVQLLGGWFAVAQGGSLRFEPPRGACPEQPWPAVPLAPGRTETPRFSVAVSPRGEAEIKNNFEIINNVYLNYMIDCDRIRDNPVIRTRLPGDRLRPAGRGVTKTLKKWMNETGVPVPLRAFVPVIADEQGVLWVYGLGADERCAAVRGTKKALEIQVIEKQGE